MYKTQENLSSVVDPDPDAERVGSALFCLIRIGIGIQGMPIRIGINSKQMIKLINCIIQIFLLITVLVEGTFS